MPVVWFPNLGIKIFELNKVAFSIFGFDVYSYAICIMIGTLLGLGSGYYLAKKAGLQTELITDAFIYGYTFGIIGARLYFVIFKWSYYKDNLLDIFNLRDGGLAIYGGIIGAQIAVLFYTKAKKMNFFELADLSAVGLAIGQAVGRFGNFFNREAYGGYTDNLFAMRILKEEAQKVTPQLLENLVVVNGAEYIQVHPTFLYESLWNVMNFIILFTYYKNRKFDGEIFVLYVLIYGVGRFFIEGLRQDQLLLWGTGIPVSQLLSLLFALSALIFLVIKKFNSQNGRRNLQSKK